MSGWFWWIASKTLPLYNELIFLNAVITVNFNLDVMLVVSFVTTWIWLKCLLFFSTLLLPKLWGRRCCPRHSQNSVSRNVPFICISPVWLNYIISGHASHISCRTYPEKEYVSGIHLWVNDSFSSLKSIPLVKMECPFL